MTPRPLALLCASVLTLVTHALDTVRAKGRPKNRRQNRPPQINRRKGGVLSTFQIKKEDSINLRNIVLSDPFKATERAIQYGVQYALNCGIKCNVHYSEKTPEILKITIQNRETDTGIADLLEFHISTISI